MYIERVRSGQPLSAISENQKIAQLNSLQDQLNTLYTPPPHFPGLVVMASNGTGAKIATGQAVTISDVKMSGDKDFLLRTYLNSGIQVTATNLSSSSQITGFALESAAENKLFRALIFGVTGALISISDSSHQYANTSSGGLISASYGEFKIIGKSSGSISEGETSYSAFCLLVPNVMTGHITGTLQNRIEGNAGNVAKGRIKIDGLTDIYLDNVFCPLLRDEETIESGSKVVLSWNTIRKRMEIVESQCPEEEEE